MCTYAVLFLYKPFGCYLCRAQDQENVRILVQNAFYIKRRGTKWRLWFAKPVIQILHIINAALWSVYTQITVVCALCGFFFIFWCIFLDTQGQNNEPRQREAKGCWIHFHGTSHQCRGSRPWCWCKAMYGLRRFSENTLWYLLPFCYCVPVTNSNIVSLCLHKVSFSTLTMNNMYVAFIVAVWPTSGITYCGVKNYFLCKDC